MIGLYIFVSLAAVGIGMFMLSKAARSREDWAVKHKKAVKIEERDSRMRANQSQKKQD